MEPINGERMDEFEAELRPALERRAAPPSLKRKLLERRSVLRVQQRHARMVMLQRMAASVALAVVLGGGFAWRRHEQVLKAEAAREQVMTALRIAARTLDQVNAELTGDDRDGQE
jgi:hypothetical protein